MGHVPAGHPPTGLPLPTYPCLVRRYCRGLLPLPRLVTHHTTCMTPSSPKGRGANRISCPPHTTRDSNRDEMLFIWDGPVPAGTKGLCHDMKRRHRGSLSLFHPFLFFNTVGSRPVFFYQLPAGHHIPFHYGWSFVSFFVWKHCLRIPGPGLETRPWWMPRGCALGFFYTRQVCRRLSVLEDRA